LEARSPHGSDRTGLAFPAAVATVERQEILVVEMHLDFVKVWLEINGFAETE